MTYVKTAIDIAIANVRDGHVERSGVPGQWRVFKEDGKVFLEQYPFPPREVAVVDPSASRTQD